jgi:hypothetical protein
MLLFSAIPAEKMTGIGESHATNPQDSMVPEALQKAVPKAAERVLPEAIHPTEGKK